MYRSFGTTVSLLKICDFSGETLKSLKCCNILRMQQRHNCSPVASFANCVMTLYLLKLHLQTFLSTPITQKCHILSCDTLVANDQCTYKFELYMMYIRAMEVSGSQNVRKIASRYEVPVREERKECNSDKVGLLLSSQI